MAVTFTITRNPRSDLVQGAYGSMAFPESFTIRADGGTASKEAFYNALIAAYPNNASHATFTNCVVVGARLASVDSPNSAYGAVVDYAQLDSGTVPDNATTSQGLVDLGPRVESVTHDWYQVPAEVDKFGKAITNSAGDCFYPAGYVERMRKVAVVSWWDWGFSSYKWQTVEGRLNNATAVIPGIGIASKRHARCLYVKPAGGYGSVVTVQASVSGDGSDGDIINWGVGNSGLFGGTVTGGFKLIDPIGPIAVGTTFTDTNTASTFAATATEAANVRPVKHFAAFEWRETGFDTKDVDQGQRGWWTDSTSGLTAISQIFHNGSICGADVPLRNGVPSFANFTNASANAYTGGTTGGNWSSNTSSTDQLASRVAAGEVARDSSNTYIDLLTFQRLPDDSFGVFPW